MVIRTRIGGDIVYSVVCATVKAIVVFKKVLQLWSRVSIFITTPCLIWGSSGPHNIITYTLSIIAICFLLNILIYIATAYKIVGAHKIYKAVSIKVVNE